MTTATIEAEDFFTAWQLELDAHLLVLAQAGRGKDHLIRRTTDRIIDDLTGSVRIIGTGHYRLTTVHPNALVSTDPHIALLAINAELDEMARRYDAITAGEPISFARRSSAFSRLRRLISTAASVVTPGRSPASTCWRRIQVRIVSGDPTPSICATALIA